MKSVLIILVLCIAQTLAAGVHEPCYFNKTLLAAQEIVAKADPNWVNQIRDVYTKWDNCPDFNIKAPTTNDFPGLATLIINIAKLGLSTFETTFNQELDYLKNKLQNLPVGNFKLSREDLIDVNYMEKIVDYIVRKHKMLKSRLGIDFKSKKDVVPYINEIEKLTDKDIEQTVSYLQKVLTEKVQPYVKKMVDQLCEIKKDPNVAPNVPQMILNIIAC